MQGRKGILRFPGGDEIVDAAAGGMKGTHGDGVLFAVKFFDKFGEGFFKKFFGAAAEQYELLQVFLVPRAGGRVAPLLFLFDEGFLRGSIVGRKECGGAVGLMNIDFAEAEPDKQAGQQIANAVVAATGGEASAMLTEPEFKTPDEYLNGFVFGERGEGEVIPQIVWLDADQESAGTENAEHFAQGIERFLEMHEQGLASHDIETVIG